MFEDKMKKHGFTEERILKAERDNHIRMKKMYGLENLHFYRNKKNSYCCKYIPDPEIFDFDEALDTLNLSFLLKSLSLQQGRVYFEDYQESCVGMDELKRMYLPLKLAGLG